MTMISVKRNKIRQCTFCEEVVEPEEIVASVERKVGYSKIEICIECVDLIMKAVSTRKKQMLASKEEGKKDDNS
jgi:hypothetical protein